MGNNPALLRAMTKITGIGHKIKSKILLPYTENTGDALLYILKRDGTNGKKFRILAEISTFGVSFQNEGYRTRTVFEVSTLEETFGTSNNQPFGEIVGIATHVAVVPNGEMFSIREGAELQIMMTDFAYNLLGQFIPDKFVKAENE